MDLKHILILGPNVADIPEVDLPTNRAEWSHYKFTLKNEDEAVNE